MPASDNFEKRLAAGRDGALLRFSLGNAYLQEGDAARAVLHLQQAVLQDAQYSAAWKLLGRALEASGDAAGALQAWRSGIAVAEARGDVQAAREMTVFARRIEKRQLSPGKPDGPL
jgi:predicted Zn-dependent protease